MASRFQAAVLAAAPSYPNAIAWSDENLIAVASGHLVIILNPALPSGPRGLITVPSSEPYPVGRVEGEDLLTGRLLPTALSRDRRPCVRSISWSPVGMATNSGCLLAVCTVEGRVKLYRPPFCDFCAEWIEVIDVSDKLYDYVSKTNFGELDTYSSEFPHEQETGEGFADELSESRVNHFPNLVTETKSRMMETNVKDSVLPLLTAEQYASRIGMLSSLAVSWSPVMSLSSNVCMVPQNVSSNMFSVLAVGGKSGEISVWRIHAPRCYSIEYSGMPTSMILVGLLQAHKSWVTTISLALLGSNSSPQILLASGSSDGSVKIWMGNGKEMLDSSGTNNSSFVVLREVIAADIVPVSVLSLVVPVQSLHKVLLAVGRGSGAVEVWAYDISGCQCDNACVYDAHGYIVTGLAWAFDGCCLYSSGQDDYVRCWVVRGSSLCEVPIPSNSPGLKSSNDLPDAFLSCLGVAISPGNLVLAMVRNPDAEQLDPMYERRAVKAAVHFFWIGGQLNMLPDTFLDVSKEAFLGFPAKELVHWESSVLWSLKKFENPEKSLVMWDIIAALLAFKQSMPNFVDRILFKWLSLTYLDSNISHSLNEVLIRVPQILPKTTSRQLHLLNIICRRVILCELSADEINCKANIGPTAADSEQLPLWLELLRISERELRERLVGLSFSALLTCMPHLAKSSTESGYWSPVGVAQMERWITRNHDLLRDQINELASEVVKTERRFQSRESGEEEQCSHCSALVPFDSPDVAFCCGTETTKGVFEKHKLARCATSMQVCPTTPLWFCKCCHRWISKLAPETFFTMPGYSLDLRPPSESPILEVSSKALCPFCGILLQRLEPDFLPSASPV